MSDKGLAKKRIMIVDDNIEFLEELKEMLVLSGYEAAAFYNGPSALEGAQRFKPDVILLDLKMDGMSGFQVADELKRIPETARTPIIAMTGYYTGKDHTLLINISGIQFRTSNQVRSQLTGEGF